MVNMKISILSLIVVLLASGCSRKSTESTAASTASTNATVTATLPQFKFAAGDLASPAKVATNRFGTFTVDLQLSGAKSDELRRFTQSHQDQQVEMVFEGKVLSSPMIQGVISNGAVQESFAASESNQAWAVADLLNKK